MENKYHTYILKALQRLTEERVTGVTYRVASAGASTEKLIEQGGSEENAAEGYIEQVQVVAEAAPALNKYGLNPKYTFDRFIVGKSTELAHAACKAVAASLGQTYNPLFLYGGVGLGKTHLIQAIGNEVAAKNRSAKILFTSCERFTNEFVQAIRSGQIESFKQSYRELDLLLVDDVQFLANKEQTQEEFFHTFNALHQANKQIVLTSDRPPKAISAIENRLVSRFEWGMIADVGKPDLETRTAILQARAHERGFPIGHEVLAFIAETVPNNVRELEGALIKLFAYYQLNKVLPSIELARSLLTAIAQESNRSNITPKKVVQMVSSYFDISLDELVGNSRRKELVVPRQIAMFLLREECLSSFPSIGHELGGRDHTTAMHACTKIKKGVDKDSRLRSDVEQIRSRLNGNSFS